jgi:HCOMODA/2-hydroxy-3-carboxy-muconic semialdehyde decarboxylase
MTDVADTDDQRIEDLVLASRMLVNEGALDSFGHLSVRSVRNPNRFFAPIAMPPGSVTREAILELDLDANQIDPAAGRANGEKFIHSEIYKARPDVQAIGHGHSHVMLPFTVTPKRPLRPLIQPAGFLPERVPLYDIVELAKEEPSFRGRLLVNTAPLARALARTLGDGPAVLLRGHGFVVVGDSVPAMVMRTIYTQLNAQVQHAAETLDDEVVYLTAEERETFHKEIFPERPWANFKAKLLGKA